jgi:hypothetical protein
VPTGSPGVVELLLRVPGAHPELEPAAGHLHRRGDVAGEQCRVVERHVEHERSHVHRSVAIAAAVSAGKGGVPAQMVGHGDDVVTEFLGSPALRRPFGPAAHGPQARPESEFPHAPALATCEVEASRFADEDEGRLS